MADVRSIPIPNISKEQKNKLEILAKTILDLNQEFDNETKNSNKWTSIKSEIEKIDRQIDQLVYKLYELTDEDIKIVEGSAKS